MRGDLLVTNVPKRKAKQEAQPFDRATDYCSYSQSKIDSEVLRLAKAAASLADKDLQDWLSDVINNVASREIGRPPIKRRPARPSNEEP